MRDTPYGPQFGAIVDQTAGVDAARFAATAKGAPQELPEPRPRQKRRRGRQGHAFIGGQFVLCDRQECLETGSDFSHFDFSFLIQSRSAVRN